VRAVGLNRYGGPEVLEVVELPDPLPGPGQVRVRVHAATVNPTDTLMREGAQAALIGDRPPPWIPGMEVAGVVDAVGEGAGWSVGDPVFGITSPVIPTGGAYAERVVLSGESVARIPRGLSFAEAATLPMNGLTVRLALDLLALRPGQVLGVTGAAGAVGRYAVEMGQVDGLTVVASCAAGDAADVRALGAQAVVGRSDGWVEQMVAAAGGPVDGLLDAALIGAPAVAAVRDGGAVAEVRATDAAEAAEPRGITVYRVGVRSYLTHGRALAELARLVEDGRLSTRVAAVVPPERTAAAHIRLAEGGLRGRQVVDFGTAEVVPG
jgi:NADPH:quinone reductase-like Zn-dependent oxidoreductase